MYLSTAIGILSILTYVLAGAGIAREILATQYQSSTPIRLAWAAAALHSAHTFLNIHERSGFTFGFFNTASFTALVVAWLLLFAALDKPVAKLGVLVFPVAALLLAANVAYPSRPHPLAHHDWQLTAHILTSILAFGLLNIAAVQAILLAIQEQQLRHHHPKQFMLALPPLQAMESLLFQMIATGLVFLTISLLTGFLFIDDLFAQHLAHKTVLSILAWLIFSALLFGRLRYGWRGQSAVQWTLIGFTSLLLAYFGSKLVLELILKKI